MNTPPPRSRRVDSSSSPTPSPYQDNTPATTVPPRSTPLEKYPPIPDTLPVRALAPNEVLPFAAPPLDLPIRLNPLLPALASLDAKYNRTRHPILDIDNMWGKGLTEAREGEDVLKLEEASRVLRKHTKDRMPYVKLVSTRLQAIMGLKNELPFDLPNINAPQLSPHYQNVLDFDLDPSQASQPRNPIDGPIPDFMEIDKETGEGLRSWLLKVGTGNGSLKKKECKSISFHDITQEMMSGQFSNVLVAHYNNEKVDQKIEAYELDLPTQSIETATGREVVTTQTWVWFFISRPLLSIDSNNSYLVSPSRDPGNWMRSEATDDSFYTPFASRRPPSPPDQTRNVEPPPNFPDPVPSSWVVFACPLSNVKTYPESEEKAPNEPANSTIEEDGEDIEPSHPPAKRSNPFNTRRKKVYKRQDYDFAQQGVPIFEFSMATAEMLPINECMCT
ncbi:uncharacterized protein LY89DRAFT_783358 [Mollisia scopiformis]|uniref:Uncharacterized protein n=1 Tax=Mollisia scopiformis TaxID=149040 RepID=A0A194X4P2_MOLSC|nr:uncharacterized protein LY89DRAFT_783358 [Mollisia scopiformis]KUJ15153.1 hypothetical protein LY89DRAFT_783358 [Mollisia scopiformis]